MCCVNARPTSPARPDLMGAPFAARAPALSAQHSNPAELPAAQQPVSPTPSRATLCHTNPLPVRLNSASCHRVQARLRPFDPDLAAPGVSAASACAVSCSLACPAQLIRTGWTRGGAIEAGGNCGRAGQAGRASPGLQIVFSTRVRAGGSPQRVKPTSRRLTQSAEKGCMSVCRDGGGCDLIISHT